MDWKLVPLVCSGRKSFHDAEILFQMLWSNMIDFINSLQSQQRWLKNLKMSWSFCFGNLEGEGFQNHALFHYRKIIVACNYILVGVDPLGQVCCSCCSCYCMPGMDPLGQLCSWFGSTCRSSSTRTKENSPCAFLNLLGTHNLKPQLWFF